MASVLIGGIASTALAVSGWAINKIVGQEVANAQQQTDINNLKASIIELKNHAATTDQNVYNIAVRLGVPAAKYTPLQP